MEKVMNDVWLTCFREATETLNFTTAAQNMHISQPSFSRNIAMLEEELGFKLFLRSKQNGVRLTPAGATFYNGFSDIEKRLTDLIESSKRISRGEEGKLVIGVLNGIDLDSQSYYHISIFRERYPLVNVELRSCAMHELESCLVKGNCDICFVMAGIIRQRDEMLIERVYSIPTYYIVPKGRGFENENEYPLNALKDETFLLSDDFPEINDGLIAECRKAGFEPKTRMAPDYETKMLWAELGEGVTAVVRDQYASRSSRVDLIKVKESRNMDYSICWNKNNYNPAIAMFYALVDEVKQTADLP